MTPEQCLVCRIFEQAIEDYRALKDTGSLKLYDCCLSYSVKDIERFFGSKWCAELLDIIHSKLKGSDILKKIQTQYC